MQDFILSVAQIAAKTGYSRQRQRHFRDGNPARKEAPILIEGVHYVKQSNGGVMYSPEALNIIEAHKKTATPGRKKSKKTYYLEVTENGIIEPERQSDNTPYSITQQRVFAALIAVNAIGDKKKKPFGGFVDHDTYLAIAANNAIKSKKPE